MEGSGAPSLYYYQVGFGRQIRTPLPMLRLGNSKKHVLEGNWKILMGYLAPPKGHKG